jgi:hypothetical protein
MPSFSRTFGLASAVSAVLAACDPLAGVTVTRTLSPAPAPQCVSTALRASPLVLRADSVDVARFERRQGVVQAFVLTLPDSVGRLPDPALRAETRGDSTRLEITAQWLGTINEYPAPDRQLFANTAARVLTGVTAACAPLSPGDVRCREFGLNAHACTITAP